MTSKNWGALSRGKAKSLLQYVMGQEGNDDPLVRDIAVAVEAANGDALWRREGLAMISMEEDLRAQARIKFERGIEQGVAIGEERMAALMVLLLESGRREDALAAANDPVRRAELLVELGL